MPRILPTASYRYAPPAGDPALLLAPPYDVIDAGNARRLRERSRFNAVHLVLPEGPAPARYEVAARRLREWIADGVLCRSTRDGLWIYDQEFRQADRPRARRALLAAVVLEPFERRAVLPHERTHRAPKEDRLALMTACEAQLSPIFLVARDAQRNLATLIDQAVRGPSALDARTDDGIRHRLYAVDADLERALLGAAGADPLLIADGHHRYETALALARHLPARPAARAVLAAIVSQHDPGLLIQPTHRRLTGLPPGWRRDLARFFDANPGPSDPAALAAAVAEAGPAVIGLAPLPEAGDSPGLLLQARPEATVAAGLSTAGAGLACLLLDRLVLNRIVGADAESLAVAGRLSYIKDPPAAWPGDGDGAGLFLLPPVAMHLLWEIAEDGGRLPPKSTFFAPKIPSGLLFRPI